MSGPILAVLVVILVVLVLAAAGIRVAKEYERGVVFRLGRLTELKGPGLFLIFPFGIDRLTKVDLRVITLEVPMVAPIDAKQAGPVAAEARLD